MPDPDLNLVIAGGTYFDGTGSPGRHVDVGVIDGHIAAVGPDLPRGSATEVVDATGQWVMPGFFDNHTHYDAELLMAPGLSESVRHGVTTVMVGSCSLSTVYSSVEDCADLFTRVEALPRDMVVEALDRHRSWSGPSEYVDAVDRLALGPNVASYLGHSDMRVAAMGLGAATEEGTVPTRAQQAEMEAMLEDALDAGLVGFSSMTNPWDKVGGDRFRSRRLPSTYARWREYRRFHSILRRRGRVLQSAPNLTTKINAFAFVAESSGAGLRPSLKTTLITAADVKSNPMISRGVTGAVRAWNRLTGANIRWQSIPMPFEVYADGIDLVVFEEFGSGEQALHLEEQVERNQLFADPAYRRRFRKDYDKRFGPRVWHRDFHDAEIVSAPDESLIGRTFGAIADERGLHPADTFLDLVMEHGTAIRWRTTIGNHRGPQLERLATHPSVQLGFADSGAHIRNMAFYNFPLHFLRMVKRAAEQGRPIMSTEAAVRRLTREQAEWFGLDCGRIQVGDRADVAVIDPDGLDDTLDGYHEAPMPGADELDRMVRRNDRAVPATIIGGQVAQRSGVFVDGYGTERGFGRFLRADTPVRARDSASTPDRASVSA